MVRHEATAASSVYVCVCVCVYTHSHALILRPRAGALRGSTHQCFFEHLSEQPMLSFAGLSRERFPAQDSFF